MLLVPSGVNLKIVLSEETKRFPPGSTASAFGQYFPTPVAKTLLVPSAAYLRIVVKFAHAKTLPVASTARSPLIGISFVPVANVVFVPSGPNLTIVSVFLPSKKRLPDWSNARLPDRASMGTNIAVTHTSVRAIKNLKASTELIVPLRAPFSTPDAF
jgi:hypothetical protein